MKLTIGIPVYNGESFIEETIHSILKASFDWKEVEIIVSDNNSEDRTCEIVEKYPQIKLYRHTENLGYDKNLDRIFQYANGRYVWTIGADDIIVKQNVQEISNIISEEYEYSVIFIGESNKDFSGKRLSASEFLIQSDFRSGFLSNNIMSREMWLEIDRTPYIGSAWIHYAMVLQLLQKKYSFLSKDNYISEIEASKHDKAWGKNGRMIFTGLQLVDIFTLMKGWGYDKYMQRRAKMVIKGAYPRIIIFSKIDGFKVNFAVLERFISLYKEFASFWLVDIWFLLVPHYVFKISYSFFKKFKKIIHAED